MSVVEIRSEDQFTELTSSAPKDKLSVLYFNTPWAAPCIQIAKVFETLAKAHPEINFFSINAEEQGNIAELFEISSVPHFILIQDSVILKEVSGADPKEIVAALSDFQSGSLSNNNSPHTLEQAPPQQAANSQPASNENSVANANASAATTNNQNQIPSAKPQETEEELNQRLEKLTKAAPVMVFIKGTPSEPKCGFSRQLIAILREHQVKFGFFDILKDNAVRQGLKTFSDWPTFPQLYINGEFQGGLDIVKESLEEDPEFFNNTLSV